MQFREKNIYVDGVFDLFHEGHINLLKSAAAYGRLIVGVHSDDFVVSYKRRPVIPELTRYKVVAPRCSESSISHLEFFYEL